LQTVANIISRQVAFSPTGTFIVTIFYDERVCIWDGLSFELIWKVDMPKCRPRYIMPLLFDHSYNETCHAVLTLTNEQMLVVGGRYVQALELEGNASY
jgi:hypothetical protein